MAEGREKIGRLRKRGDDGRRITVGVLSSTMLQLKGLCKWVNFLSGYIAKG